MQNYLPHTTKVDGERGYLLLDPRCDVSQTPYYTIEKGASEVRYVSQDAQSVSSTQLQFNVITPSKDTCVSRKIYIDVEAQFTFTGPAVVAQALLPTTLGATSPTTGTDLMLGQTGALRFLPLQSCTNNLQMEINGESFAQRQSEYIEVLTRSNLGDFLANEDYSVAPILHDNRQSYSQGNATNNNPLDQYGNSYRVPRGAFSYRIDNNVVNTGTSQITVKWSEPILMSPLIMRKGDSKGLIGCTNLKFVFGLKDLSRMWSLDQVNNPRITGVSAAFVGNPSLRICYLNIPTSIEPIRLVNKYPFYDIDSYPSEQQAVVNSGVSSEMNISNIQISSVPKLLYIVVREKDSDRDFTKADAYARIDSIDITWGNKNGLLASATPEDLYAISVRNGLKMSFDQWYNKSGSVVILHFGRDISMPEDKAVGSSGQYNLRAKINFTNISGRNITHAGYLITVADGIFTLQDTSPSKKIGQISSWDVLTALQVGSLQRTYYDSQRDVLGGSFASSLKDFGEGIKHGLEKGWEGIKKVGSKLLPFTPLLRLAPLLLGLGYEKGLVDRYIRLNTSDMNLSGMGLSGSGLSGGTYIGGNPVSDVVGGKIATNRRLRGKL